MRDSNLSGRFTLTLAKKQFGVEKSLKVICIVSASVQPSHDALSGSLERDSRPDAQDAPDGDRVLRGAGASGCEHGQVAHRPCTSKLLYDGTVGTTGAHRDNLLVN